MASFNTSRLDVRCPRCGKRSDMVVQIWIGERNLTEYAIGDEIRWRRAGRRGAPRDAAPGEAEPADGNLDAEGFATCPKCDAAIGLSVHVRNGRLDGADVDFARTSTWTDHRVDPDRASKTHWAVRAPAKG